MKSLRYLNKYFIRYKWRFLLGILFIAATNFFKVKMPEYFGNQMDNLKNIDPTDAENIILIALAAGGMYMLIGLISGIFLFFTRQAIIVMSRFIEYDMKNEIYNHYQELDYSFYKKNSTGDLMTRISDDVSKVRMYLGPGVMYSINLLALSILTVYSMVSISPFLTIFVLLPLPIMSFIIYKVSSRISRLSSEVQKEQSSMATLVQEGFSGIRVIKAFGREKSIKEKFNQSSEAYMKRSMRLVLTNALFAPTIFMLIGISTVLCIYLGGLLSFEGNWTGDVISIGDILKFIFYVNLLTWPFASIGWVISLTQRAEASQARINEFLSTEPNVKNNNNKPFSFEGKIEFREVSYTFPNSGIQAIKNLSFTINKGETLGIIGRTGSGKSTIIALLLRQIEPDSGEILIDGVPLKEINLKIFRDQIGVVPQDVFLFSDTIRNNMLFGTKREDVTDEELFDIARKAHILHNIQDFKFGLDTILGERGVNLSGGQKQRLSIARALIRNPKLLILDDCLSAVDTETEEVILRNLKEENVMASLVVSHRVSTTRNATHILVLDNGMKAEFGNHQQLLHNNSIYAEIYNKQLMEDVTDAAEE